MAEDVERPARSVSPSRAVAPADYHTSVPARISSTPTLTANSKDSTRSFPAFRLKKSYWRKDKQRSSRTAEKEPVVQMFSHRLPSYGKIKPAPAPLAELVTVTQDKRGYDSLSRLRKSTAEVAEYPLWRRLVLSNKTHSDERRSPPPADRNLLLSIESLRGKYGRSKPKKTNGEVGRLHTHSQQRDNWKQTLTPPPRLTKSYGKLLPIGTLQADRPRPIGNTRIILPGVYRMPAL